MAILRQETGEKYDPALMQIFSEHIEASEFRAGRD